MANEKVDLDRFLGKVDQIGDIIKNLAAANDSEDHKKAIEKADTLLQNLKLKENEKQIISKEKTGVDRTVINKKHTDDPRSGPMLNPDMDQEAFMRTLEKDAQDRATKKKRLREEATAIKERGNEEFNKGNYVAAIELYTEALTKVKDYSALWTNRAQCHLKLQKYDQALEDCDWALRVSDKCLKAYIHKSKALAGLQRYEEALDCLHIALEMDPSKKNAITEYIHQVELQMRSAEEEQFARESFESGDLSAKGIVEILEKLNRLDQLPYYYSGGLRLLAQALTDTKQKTLFRTSGGLTLTEKHGFISKCMNASPRSLSQGELDMCAAALDTYATAVTENEENQRIVLECKMLPQQITKYLESQWKGTRSMKEASLTLLHVLSENDRSRTVLVSSYDLNKLLPCLFTLMRSKNDVIAGKSVGLLNNLALDKKFKIQLRDKIDELLPSLESAMTDMDMRPGCISTITNLCGDPVIRQKLQQRKQIWEASTLILEKLSSQYNEPLNFEMLFSLLGLLLNLSIDGSTNLKEFSSRICSQCLLLVRCGKEGLEERSLSVLSHALPHSIQAVEDACTAGLVSLLLDILQDQVGLVKAALKTLTVCTLHSTTARQNILSYPKGLKRVYDLLKSKDEMILGNASLCLSHCVTLSGVSDALVNTNVLMNLLVLARDSNNTQVRQNCAILIAKLTQADQRHLDRLRQLDGLGILHDVMKFIKE